MAPDPTIIERSAGCDEYVTPGLSVAAHFGAFSSSEPVAVVVALDAVACADLMRGVAAKWAKSLRAAPHEGRWRFLGSSD